MGSLRTVMINGQTIRAINGRDRRGKPTIWLFKKDVIVKLKISNTDIINMTDTDDRDTTRVRSGTRFITESIVKQEAVMEILKSKKEKSEKKEESKKEGEEKSKEDCGEMVEPKSFPEMLTEVIKGFDPSVKVYAPFKILDYELEAFIPQHRLAIKIGKSKKNRALAAELKAILNCKFVEMDEKTEDLEIVGKILGLINEREIKVNEINEKTKTMPKPKKTKLPRPPMPPKLR